MMKQCVVCGKEFIGQNSRTLTCSPLHSKQYAVQWTGIWRMTHKKEISDRMKRWWKENKHKVKEENCRRSKEYYYRNREVINPKRKLRLLSNPEMSEKKRVSDRKRNQKMRAAFLALKELGIQI